MSRVRHVFRISRILISGSSCALGHSSSSRAKVNALSIRRSMCGVLLRSNFLELTASFGRIEQHRSRKGRVSANSRPGKIATAAAHSIFSLDVRYRPEHRGAVGASSGRVEKASG